MARLNFANLIELSMIGSSDSELNNIPMGGPVTRACAPTSKAIQSLKIVKSGEEEKPEEECAICIEKLFSKENNEAVVKETPCEHRYHGKCIEKWLEKHVSCPLCRCKMPQDREPDNVHQVEIGSIIRRQLAIEIFGDA